VISFLKEKKGKKRREKIRLFDSARNMIFLKEKRGKKRREKEDHLIPQGM
jgi:hypothetical protein